jgi:hypothetical protein
VTRAHHHGAQHRAPAWARTILSSRRRLQAHAAPATRYSLIGAPVLLAARTALAIHPRPCERTRERVRERNGWTAPRRRRAPVRPRQEWPGPQARASNERHAVDRVGPSDLLGRGHRYDLWAGTDAFAGAGGLRLAASRRRDDVLWVLGECGQDLRIPEPVQCDHAREVAGWGPAARPRSRVIRLGLRLGASPVFIPAGEPQGNGSVANVNGWFQAPRLQRRCRRPGELRRELTRLPEAVHTQQVHPRRHGLTPAPHRRGLRLRKLPARFGVPTERRPLADGRVPFLRRVRGAGTVTVLSQSLRVGKRPRGLYLRLVVATGRGLLTASRHGRVLQRWPDQLLHN